MAVTALLLIGCGAGPDSETSGTAIPDGYPTIASPDFHATFEVTGSTVGGRVVDLGAASTRQMRFDVVTGEARVDLGCDRRLGSFTLADDGQASITLTGRSVIDPCQPSPVDDALWELIDRVERWEPTADGFRLVTAGGDDLVLTRI